MRNSESKVNAGTNEDEAAFTPYNSIQPFNVGEGSAIFPLGLDLHIDRLFDEIPDDKIKEQARKALVSSFILGKQCEGAILSPKQMELNRRSNGNLFFGAYNTGTFVPDQNLIKVPSGKSLREGECNMTEIRSRMTKKLAAQLGLWGVDPEEIAGQHPILADVIPKISLSVSDLARGAADIAPSPQTIGMKEDPLKAICDFMNKNHAIIAERIMDAYTLKSPAHIVIPSGSEEEISFTIKPCPGLSELNVIVSGAMIEYSFRSIEGSRHIFSGKGQYPFGDEKETKSLQELEPRIPAGIVDVGFLPEVGVAMTNPQGLIKLSPIEAREKGLKVDWDRK